MPASELKIDRGFIQELSQGTENAAIVSAIIALGRTLNLEILAEGVETLPQREYLCQLGCNSLQGFLLGHPMAPDQLLAEVQKGGTAWTPYEHVSDRSPRLAAQILLARA